MAGAVGSITSELIIIYHAFIQAMPPIVASFFNLLLLVLLIVVYSIFIWKFYRFIATKNLIELNLSRYNRMSHPTFEKMVASFFYIVEYLLILPFLIFFWFSIFTIFLIFLTENLTIDKLLIISATVIAAIRMTAYYNENLSKEVAKMLPFMLLAVSILTPGFFDVERIIGQISQIPSFFGNITLYLTMIISLEIILRLFDFIISLFGLEDEVVDEAE